MVNANVHIMCVHVICSYISLAFKSEGPTNPMFCVSATMTGRLRRPHDPPREQQAELRAGGSDLVGVRMRAKGAARSLRQGHGG